MQRWASVTTAVVGSEHCAGGRWPVWSGVERSSGEEREEEE
jgi:hypothetical protein